MSESKFHRNHEEHTSFSENLSVEVKKTGQDLLKQITDMDPKMSNQLLLKLVNRMVGNIFNIIADLQEIVIKSNAEEKSNTVLKEVVEKLSQYCNEVVQAYDNNSSSLKLKFLEFVQNLMVGTEELLSVIKTSDLQNFKHELVESLKEILYTIYFVQARIRIQNFTRQDFKTAVEALQQEYFEDIHEIGKCSLEVLKTVAIHVKHTCKFNFQLAHYLNKVASNYDNDFQHNMLEAANLINIATTAFLFESEKMKNTQEAIIALENVTINCWNSVLGIFEFIENCLEDKKSAENLKDIVMHVLSYGFVLNKQLGKNVKNDGLFAC